MDSIIKIKGVRKQFNKKVILDNIDVEIRKGEVFGIIGMSGSGKSTLLSTLIGFYEPEEGEILYYSELHKKHLSLYSNTDAVISQIGFATQAASFYPKLTVMENLDHFGSLYSIKGKERKQRVSHIMSVTGLENAKHTLAQDLSGGMEKRLSISCAMIHAPSVLLLDEPTADLDPISRRSTWELIKHINSQGTTVVIASHLLEELELICDRVAILHKGKMVDVGTPNEIKARYFKNDEILVETSKKNYVAIGKMLKRISRYPIETIAIRDDKLLIRTKEADKVFRQLLPLIERMDGEIISADIRKPSLTEVFESLESTK